MTPAPLRLALIALLVWGSVVSSLHAQERAPLSLGLPASTEALGLGDVFPISGSDPDAIFYNAAGLMTAEGVGLAGQRFGDQSTLLGASGATGWLDGAVGIGVQALTYDAASDPAGPSVDDLFDDGEVGAGELVASLAYARELGPVRLGAAGKLVQMQLGGAQASSAALDVGAAWELDFLTLGLSIQNIGSDLDLGQVELGLPDRVTLSGAFEPEPLGPLDVRAAARVARRSDGEVVPAAGVDVRYWPIQGRTFIGRFGLRRIPEGPASPFSFGLAFWGDQVSLEYAFQAYEGEDDSHRVGVRWRVPD